MHLFAYTLLGVHRWPPENGVNDIGERPLQANTDDDRETEYFICEHCQKPFSRKEHLKRHSARHIPSQQFSCLLCCREFRRRQVHITAT